MTIHLTVEVFTSDGCAPLYEDAQSALRKVIENAELTWHDPSLRRVISANAAVTSTEPGTP